MKESIDYMDSFLFLAVWATMVLAENGVRNVAVRDKLYWAVVVA